MSDPILVVDDKDGIRSFIAEVLQAAGYDVATAGDGADAVPLLESQSFHLVITDLKMPRMDGMSLLERARTISPDTAVILLTAHGTVETAVRAMKLGAFDYLTKPLESPEALRLITARALEHRAQRLSASQGDVTSDMVAADPASLQVVSLIKKVARTDATVLLLGESGVGKEVAASEIHRQSERHAAPFVAVNCAAITETLVESEMFGHVRGAFTGADRDRPGRFEQADGGTLFLDEVGELPLPLQAKLLRVLQERRLERVGSTRTVEVDVRVIAATNRDLEAEIDAGRFRADLFHRLSVFPVDIPPLRNRPKDIHVLAAHLLGRIAERLKRPDLHLTDEAKARLTAHDWPGNVRELGNVLERAAILADGDTIDIDDLMLKTTPSTSAAGAADHSDIGPSLRDAEREAIRKALEATDGHRKRAAERLGIGLRTLYNKLKEYGLE